MVKAREGGVRGKEGGSRRFKHHQNSTRRLPGEGRNKENCGGRVKNREILGLPPFGWFHFSGFGPLLRCPLPSLSLGHDQRILFMYPIAESLPQLTPHDYRLRFRLLETSSAPIQHPSSCSSHAFDRAQQWSFSVGCHQVSRELQTLDECSQARRLGSSELSHSDGTHRTVDFKFSGKDIPGEHSHLIEHFKILAPRLLTIITCRTSPPCKLGATHRSDITRALPALVYLVVPQAPQTSRNPPSSPKSRNPPR